MNTQQIKRAKRLAEILGMNHVEVGGNVLVSFGFNCDKPFKPEQDKALLWDLMTDYQVDAYHFSGHRGRFVSDEGEFWYNSKNKIPAALIDCVIEINGGYHE